MFKKLRDKIAEEVKQSPLKFQASVQQITQTVSPSSSQSVNNSFSDLVAEDEEIPDERNELSNDVSSASEFDGSFTTVDLRSPSTSKTRRLSSSSITSELFPIYEVPPTRYNLQSDLESCSEFDDGSSIHQYNNVSKENLYEKYRNILQKYHKYRGRFVDAQKYCQELQRELNKAKNVLTETQDKAIRRIAELKEQSSLDQKAKAHLEDALRNELEERDHIINTLNTKIELLKSGKDCDDISSSIPKSCSNEPSSSLETENLKEKIKNFEVLLSKAKDAITMKNSQIQELQARAESDNNQLKLSKDRISELQNRIDLMKHKEEESLLSLAENKLNVHQELEAKESQIKSLENKIAELERETKKLKNVIAVSEVEKHDAFVDTSSVTNHDELKALKEELQQLKIARDNDLTILTEKDRLLHEFKTAVDSSNHELLKLKNEIKAANIFTKAEDVKAADLHNSLMQSENNVKKLELSLSEKQNELKAFKRAKDTEISNLKETKSQLVGKISELEQKLSVAKTEAIGSSSLADSLKDEITLLNETVQKTKAALDEKEILLAKKSDLVNQLEADLAAANTNLKATSVERKTWQEVETHLKADKIVLEETLKTLRNELNACQTELRNAKNSIASYEKTLEKKESLVAEKTEIEKRLTECDIELTRSKTEVERIKKSEQEMLLQTTSLLQEINDLKYREDEHLQQIEGLKTDINTLQKSVEKAEQCSDETKQKDNENLKNRLELLELKITEVQGLNETLSVERAELEEQIKKLQMSHNTEDMLKQRNEEYKDLLRKHEILKKELEQLKRHSADLQQANDTFKSERTELEEQVKKLQKSCDENKDLLTRLRILETEQDKWKQNAEELSRLKEQNDDLLKANDKLKLDHQNWQKAVEEKEKLLKENDALKAKNDSEQILIQKEKDNLKHQNERLNFEYQYLEKMMSSLDEQKEYLQRENDALKVKIEQTEKALFEERDTVSSLSKKYEEMVSCVNVNENFKQQTEETIKNLSSELQKFQTLYQNLQNDNDLYAVTHNEVSLFLREVKSVIEQCLHYKNLIADLQSKNQNLILDDENNFKNIKHLKTEVARLIVENKSLNDEICRLNSALEYSKISAGGKPAVDPNVFISVKKQAASLKTEYLQFKNDLINSVNVLRRFCVDCGEQMKNGGIKTIQSHLKAFAVLENRLNNLEPQYELLKKGKFLLEDERKQLQARVNELSSTLENFKSENADTDRKIQLVEDMYTSKMKHIMADFETQLAQKENECEELRNKLFLRNDQENAVVAQETKEIVQNFQKELTNSQDAYEQLLEKYKLDIEKLNNEKLELKEQHVRELKESDKKWRLCLDRKIVEMEEKHKEEISELTKEWSADRKRIDSASLVENTLENQILEDFANRTEESETLKTQVQLLSNDLNTCKKSQWKDIDLELYNAYGNSNHSRVSIEDCTEMEYLRNILFEYMMGHQPLVLAKVLAAVVKFDNDQTKQILQREEQKLSLFGQLGLT